MDAKTAYPGSHGAIAPLKQKQFAGVNPRFWEDYLTLRNRVRKQVLCYKLAPIVNQFIIAKH